MVNHPLLITAAALWWGWIGYRFVVFVTCDCGCH